jgi:hypothetical protein
MMSSVIPARLVFQCGHAALVSLPRVKGESSTQRADRVAREKSDAHTRACDFCAQRLEVVVQHTAPAPAPVPTPAPVAVVTPVPPVAPVVPAAPPPEPVHAVVPPPPEPVAPPAEVVRLVTDATPPAAAMPLADWHADRMAKAKPRPVVKRAAQKGRVVARVKRPAQNRRVVASVRRPTQNGRVAQGARFSVQFQVETVLRAADVRDALRQTQSLGAIEVLAITREG